MNGILVVVEGFFCFAYRDDIVTWLARRFTLVDITMWAIQFFSTIPERLLLLAFCSVGMGAVLILARLPCSLRLRLLTPIIGSFVLFRALYVIFPRNYGGDIALSLSVLMAFIHMQKKRPNADVARFGILRWLLSLIVIPLLGVVFLNGWSLQGFARYLHKDESVHEFASGDFNNLAFDSEGGLLYVSGHGVQSLLAYDVHNLNQSPRKSAVPTNGAQSFYYNRSSRELYVYNDADRALLILNARTLNCERSIGGLDLMEGDARVAYDTQHERIIIASEGTYWGSPPEPKGYPIAVLGHETGRLLYSVKECGGDLCTPGLIDMHPTKPLLYMAFPKKVMAYSMVNQRVVGTSAVADQWVDGMAVTPDGKELLVGAPLRSEVLRFDAESLKLKDSIRTVFGVRTLAIDPERNLLLTASLATNMLDVIDLATSRRVAKYYVAPWLRDICLDIKTGMAYVSSVQGLFRVQYTGRLSANSYAAAGGKRGLGKR